MSGYVGNCGYFYLQVYVCECMCVHMYVYLCDCVYACVCLWQR